MEAILLYITTADKPQAQLIARALVDARLAACANVIEGVTSVYRWNNAVREDAECIVIAKTLRRHASAAIDKVRELHSYDCSCVIAVPIVAGNPQFLSWITQETDA